MDQRRAFHGDRPAVLAFALGVLTLLISLRVPLFFGTGWPQAAFGLAQVGLFIYVMVSLRRLLYLHQRSRVLDGAIVAAIVLVVLRSLCSVASGVVGLDLVYGSDPVVDALVATGILSLHARHYLNIPTVEAGPLFVLVPWVSALCGVAFVVLGLRLQRFKDRPGGPFEQYWATLVIAGGSWAAASLFPGGLAAGLSIFATIAEAASDVTLGMVFRRSGEAAPDSFLSGVLSETGTRIAIVAIVSAIGLVYCFLMTFAAAFCADFSSSTCATSLLWPVGLFALLVIGFDGAVLRGNKATAATLFIGSVLVAAFGIWNGAH